MQGALRLIYPPQCISCGDLVETEGALCSSCWRGTQFITGTICDCCGVPLIGEREPDELLHCDRCRDHPPLWNRGRAAVLYKDIGRKLVLGLKHGDRQDFAKPAATWMSRVADDIVEEDTVVAPVPLHWSRFLKRRYNQSALLSREISYQLGLEHCADLLKRVRRTVSLEGLGPIERAATLETAIAVNPRRRHILEGRPVLLVDDVLTTGATFNAAAKACFASRACEVNVITLARVAQDT